MATKLLVATLLVFVAAQLVSAAVVQHAHTTPVTHTHPPTTPDPLLDEIADLKQNIEGIARQMVMQQLFVEESIRSSGASGLKQIQRKHHGTKSYFAESHTDTKIGGIHDYPTTPRQLSMSDNTYVMNGIEFRTGPMSYSLKMPSTKNQNLHSTEDIPFPDVPPSVLSKRNITEQIHEMAQYFKAFKNQDSQIRADFRNYFKPVVCYLEAGWFGYSKSLDRGVLRTDHTAEFWLNAGVNKQFVPMKIMKVVNGTSYFGHWHHRTLCHPIKRTIELRDFYTSDELAPRMAQQKGFYDFAKSPSARFKMARNHGYSLNPDVGFAKEFPAGTSHTTLDSIMEEIPGKNNYPADLSDSSFGLTPYNALFRGNQTVLNTGYYHSWYKVGQKGAMGTTTISRGYSDEFLYVAQTTQDVVSPMSYHACQYNATLKMKVCAENTVRYTYAIPLEIIWLTPLLKWNPYRLHVYHGDPRKAPANTITSHGRNGRPTNQTAYLGVNDNHYYLTPREFYDAHMSTKGVLDSHGVMHKVVESGIHTISPSIKDVGRVRLRYPILPLHKESNAVYRQLDALKEIVMNMAHNAKFFEESPVGLYTGNQTSGNAVQIHYTTARSTAQSPPPHTHDIYLDNDMIKKLNSGGTVSVYTSLNEGHSHMLELHNILHHYNSYEIQKCDGMDSCFDGHLKPIYRQRY